MSKSNTGTREWSAHSVNIQTGCENGCKYCYAKEMAIRYGRATAESWKVPVPNKKPITRHYYREGVWMFPTTHDIARTNVHACIYTLMMVLESGNRVLIVSKADSMALGELRTNLKQWISQVEIRVTIGTHSDRAREIWEPGAPTIQDRYLALKQAHDGGWRTSVSMEPILNCAPELIIESARMYVTESIWLGLMNRAHARLAKNCPGDTAILKTYEDLSGYWTDEHVMELYRQYQNDPLIRWKDSIRAIVAKGGERCE